MTQNITYGESVSNDVRQYKMDASWVQDDMYHNGWSNMQVKALQRDVLKLLQEDYSVLNLCKLSVILGCISQKLDLTGDESTASTVRHLLGTLGYACHIADHGGMILRIEACDNTKMRVMSDIDLCYDLNGVIHMVDYTQCRTKESGFIILQPDTNRLIKSKYKKLRAMYPNYVTEVVSWSDAPMIKGLATVNINKNCCRLSDYDNADDLSEFIRNTSLVDAESSLDLYAQWCDRCKSDVKDMVSRPRNASTKNVFHMISNNDQTVAEQYLEYRDSISDAAMDKHYSGAYYEQLSDAGGIEGLSSKAKMPLWERGDLNQDPWIRLRHIERDLQSSGVQCNSLVHSIVACANGPSTFCLGTIEGVAERCANQDGYLNIVKLTFSHGSFKDIDAYLSSNTITPHVSGGYLEAEQWLSEISEEWELDGQGSQEMDLVLHQLAGVTGGQLQDDVRHFMMAEYNEFRKTRIMMWISQQQEISRALLAVMKKTHLIKSKGGYHKKVIYLSVDTISDLKAVAITNMGPANFSATSTWSFFVIGKPIAMSCLSSTYKGSSRCFSKTMAHLDWDCTLCEKAISYYTLFIESRYTTLGNKISTAGERVFPLLLLVQNDNKFAQASEMVRYLFVNGTGMCSSPKKLFDKISWYTPVSMEQKLYMLRMCKMSDMLQVFKSLDITDDLRVQHVGPMETATGGFIKRLAEHWSVAMPNEKSPSGSDHMLFNSFYICRAMTIQRYNKLQSETLVIEKQLDSREEYLKVKGENLEHELRFYKSQVTQEHFLQELVRFSSSNTGPWSASWRAQALSIMSTALLLKSDKDVTVGSVFDRVHSVNGVLRELDIADVLNTRGSVTSNSKSGLVVSQRKVINGKVKKVTQNGKCWENVLLAQQDMLNGICPPESNYYVQAEPAYETKPALDMKLLTHASSSLWPLIVWASDNHAMCVSKMVHKDQIGSREIAVLNAWSRVMCYYTECISRRIRDEEHAHGLRTNLIEITDKIRIVGSTLNKARASKALGLLTLLDSGDCSKWGPSMMCGNLYLTLKCRMGNTVPADILRNCLSLFGSKVFKIPDHFYMTKTSMHKSLSKIDQISYRLQTMSPEVGSYENQIIRLEESMHQGILGVTSSVYGSDAHNLSNAVLERCFKPEGLKCRTHITSDDYVRTLVFSSSQQKFRMAKQTLAVHCQVLNDCGIQRNLQKSALSQHYVEFNSVFHTYSGDFLPDIKQRLSYIDYGHSTDYAANSMEMSTQMSEYLRNDGGYIGACWIGVLRNSLLMTQHQLHRLKQLIGVGIYHIPLELGGLFSVEPLKHVQGTQLLSLIKNYSRNQSVEEAYNMLLSHQAETVNTIEVLQEDAKLRVCSMSRSGIVRVTKRPLRKSRMIKEYMEQLSNEMYQPLLLGVHSGSLIPALMACAHREAKDELESSQGIRLANCMHSKDHDTFLVNCSAWTASTSLISKLDLEKMALKFASGDIPQVPNRVPDVHIELIGKLNESINDFYRFMHLSKLHWFPRHVSYLPYRFSISDSQYVQQKLEDFDQEYNPIHNPSVSAWTYLECKEAYRARLNKLTHRSSVFTMALLEGEDRGCSMNNLIFKSNAVAGMRASFTGIEMIHEIKNIDVELEMSMKALNDCKHVSDGVTLQFTSPRYPAMMRAGKVGMTDITGLLNVLSGDLQYTFNNEALRHQLAQFLYEVGKRDPGKLVIKPRRLSRFFPDFKFTSVYGNDVYQRQIMATDGETSGREFIFKLNKWIHYWMMIDYDCPRPPEDSSTDEYILLDTIDQDYATVEIDELHSCVAVLINDMPVQILSSTVFETTTVQLLCNAPLTDWNNLAELKALGCFQLDKNVMSSITETYAVSQGCAFSVAKELEDEGANEIDDFLENGEVDVWRTDTDIKIENPDVGFLDDLLDSDDEDESEEDSSDDDESESEEENKEENVYEQLDNIKPLSHPGSNIPTLLKTKYLDHSSFVEKTEMMPRIKASGRHLYSFKIPYKLQVVNFKDDPGLSAVRKLFNALSKLDDVDHMWLEKYVQLTIGQHPLISSAYHLYEENLSSTQDVQDDLDDAEFI